MPNHVQNHIKVSGNPQRVQEFLEKVQNDEYGIGTLDFQKIIPMPEDENDPYHWHIYNWGTKWNASETYWNSDNIVTFETAWSCPVPIFERLSEMFPDVQFEVAFADEDIGCNCGILLYNDSEGTQINYFNGGGTQISHFYDKDREAIEFAQSIWDGTFEFEEE